jgi:predicted RNA binding protein YcfA (HicA-like mRNA interferase family)
MPPIGPISRRQFISTLKQIGFSGPYSGGKHQYMVKNQLRLYIPNPHQGDISRAFLIRILQQAGIERDEWEKL